MKHTRLLLLILPLVIWFGAVPALAGVVSVSNYPLALLSHEVTKGKHDAQLLLEGGDAGHHGTLSPSKIRLIEDSDYVVWFGQSLEQNLSKNLQTAPNAISLLAFDAFYRLPLRDIDGLPQEGEDVHLWLNPDNAKAIVRALAVVHGYANPEYRHYYQENARAFEQKMDQVVQSLTTTRTANYWAYHDAYQYIEQAAGLKFIAALAADHHLSPTVHQLKKLSETISPTTKCLIAQQPVSQGMQSKLGKPRIVVVQEDMSDTATDFVQAWQNMVMSMQHCAGLR